MKDGYIKPLIDTRPAAPITPQIQRGTASTQSATEKAADAAVPNLKPEIENPEDASQALEAITQKLGVARSRGLDAVGAFDAERINKLLSDD